MTRTGQSHTIRVCVDNAEEGCLCGQIYSRQMSEPLSFTDAGSLVLKIEEILEARNFPQAYQCVRTFGTKKPVLCDLTGEAGECLSDEIISSAKGRKATFEVSVHTRLNCTWQGSVDWLDGKSPQLFSSDLEFLRLVDGHIC